jgi:hypothetical protein
MEEITEEEEKALYNEELSDLHAVIVRE